MLYLLYRIGFFILRFANLKIVYFIVCLCAKIKYYTSARDRSNVRANIRNIVPEASKKEITVFSKEVFINFGKYLVDFFWLTKNQKAYLKNRVQIIGIENIDEVLKLGKGCILISGHFGNWELGGCVLANLGYKINAIVLEHADPRINEFFVRLRKRVGVNIIPTGSVIKDCKKALEHNELIAILGDRPYGDRGIEVEFFGKKAAVPRGPALLSLRNQAPIVFAFMYKVDTNTNFYKLVFEKPMLFGKKTFSSRQIKDITQQIIKSLEHYIQKYPSQWYMFNKVWKD